MNIKIGEEEKEVILSVETLTIYEEEFDRDLIQDFFGVVKIKKDDLIEFDSLSDEENSSETSDAEETLNDGDEVALTIDYTTTNWTSITKVLWAGLRTADRSTPAYAAWVKHLGPINLNAINNQLTPECIRQFFC